MERKGMMAMAAHVSTRGHGTNLIVSRVLDKKHVKVEHLYLFNFKGKRYWFTRGMDLQIKLVSDGRIQDCYEITVKDPGEDEELKKLRLCVSMPELIKIVMTVSP
jgi:hypothetical protein